MLEKHNNLDEQARHDSAVANEPQPNGWRHANWVESNYDFGEGVGMGIRFKPTDSTESFVLMLQWRDAAEGIAIRSPAEAAAWLRRLAEKCERVDRCVS